VFTATSKEGSSFFLTNKRFSLETEIYWFGIDQVPWEQVSKKVWVELSKKSKVVIDVGANSGIYALLSKANNPSCEVVAFEPQKNIYEVMCANNKVNKFNIKCFMLALSDEDGEQNFYNYGSDPFNSGNTTAGSLNKEWRPDQQKFTSVTVCRLEPLLQKLNFGRIDLVKIDVETYEYQVLLGYGQLLFEHRPIILLEIQSSEIGKNVVGLFDGHDYRAFNIDESKGLRPMVDLNFSYSDKNYLLCPFEKLDLIQSFIV
jgi:FkbM family methyltransferase